MDFQVFLSNRVNLKFGKNFISFDPKISDLLSFVSHSHSDHSPYKIIEKPLCTKETNKLIKARNENFDCILAKEDKKIKFDDFSVTLLSSGHMLGSAQVFLETKETSILYTGDFKLSNGLTSNPIKIKNAEILLIESTYCHPSIRFPNIEEVRESLVKWIKEKLKRGEKVELRAYPLGKSQEVIKLLNFEGIVPQVSKEIRKYCNIYNEFGKKLEILEENEKSEICIKPMNNITKNSCVLSGKVLFKNYGCKGFPLSDHCDFYQSIEFVKEVNPKIVFCFHGFENVFAKEIKKRLGIKAFPLKRKQKSLKEFFHDSTK